MWGLFPLWAQRSSFSTVPWSRCSRVKDSVSRCGCYGSCCVPCPGHTLCQSHVICPPLTQPSRTSPHRGRWLHALPSWCHAKVRVLPGGAASGGWASVTQHGRYRNGSLSWSCLPPEAPLTPGQPWGGLSSQSCSNLASGGLWVPSAPSPQGPRALSQLPRESVPSS